MTQNASARRSIAGEIRAVMGRSRMSGRELAARAGLSQTALARRLNGQIPINVDELASVAAALAVPVASLVAPLDEDAASTEVEAAS